MMRIIEKAKYLPCQRNLWLISREKRHINIDLRFSIVIKAREKYRHQNVSYLVTYLYTYVYITINLTYFTINIFA